MGFTIMLQVCERVLLSTRPGRTAVVLEFAGRAGRRWRAWTPVEAEAS